MTTRDFATVSVRLLGFAAIVVGAVLMGTSGVMRILGLTSFTGSTTTDFQLHDTYYVVTHLHDAWLAPGAVSVAAGIVLLVCARRLGSRARNGVVELRTHAHNRVPPNEKRIALTGARAEGEQILVDATACGASMLSRVERARG